MDQIIDIMDIIKKRRSIRVYKNNSLPKDTIDSILEAVRYTPTARDLQQLEYKVITNKNLIQKISDRIVEIAKDEIPSLQTREDPDKIFHSAPFLILITGPRDNPWIDVEAGLAAQNIMLYATSIDLGTCFIGLIKFIEKDKEMLKELNIDEGKRIAAAVICGYVDEKPPEKEKKMNVEFFQ